MLSLLKDLVATNSENPPGREDKVAKVLRDHMESHGIGCVSVGPSRRPNLIFSSHDGRRGHLVMHGHMDTVPVGKPERWSHDPFGSEIIDGLLYGRGACDMKGSVAALAETLIIYTEEHHSQPLLVLNTSDEEIGCSGAEKVVKSGELAGVRYGVCAEPTNMQVLAGEKGLLWSRVVATGKSAHGSRPEEGVNAISACIEAIDVLISDEYPYERDRLLGKPTISVGLIRGGILVNVVPDSCEAQLDLRIVKGQTPESLLKLMNERLNSAGLSNRVRVEYMLGMPVVLTPHNSAIVQVAVEEVARVTGARPTLGVATYGTDCSVLQPKSGILNIICGPGLIEHAHQPDEHISLNQLYKAVDVYLGIARRFDK